MKNCYLLSLFFILLGCKNSVESIIPGVWESSYQNDGIYVISRTTFSRGEYKYFSTKGEYTTQNGKSCKFSLMGDYRIRNNTVLSLKYLDVYIYDCNSYFIEDRIRKEIGKIKNQTHTYKILNAEPKVLLIEDMLNYKVYTYKKVEEPQSYENDIENLQQNEKEKSDEHYGKKREM